MKDHVCDQFNFYNKSVHDVFSGFINILRFFMLPEFLALKFCLFLKLILSIFSLSFLIFCFCKIIYALKGALSLSGCDIDL